MEHWLELELEQLPPRQLLQLQLQPVLHLLLPTLSSCSSPSASRRPGLSASLSRLRSTTTPSPSSQSGAAEFLLLRESQPRSSLSLPRFLRGSSRLLNRSLRDLNLSSPDHRLSNLDLNLSSLDHRLSSLDHRLSNLDHNRSSQDHRLSHLDLRLSNLDLRLPQQDLSPLLSSSLDSSQSHSQLEDRGQLPSQPSLGEHPEPAPSRDHSWEFLLSSRASSLSLPSLTAGSSRDLRASPS